MPKVIIPKSDGEFPTPGTTSQPVHEQTVDEHNHPVADVEFPMPGTETVYYDDHDRKAAKAEAKTVDAGTVDTKVIDADRAAKKGRRAK